VTYAYVPSPSTPLAQLPQFDSALPSLLLLPFNFPITTTLIPLTARTSFVSACATRSRPSATDSSTIWLIGTLMLDWRLTRSESEQSRRAVQPAGKFQRPVLRPRVQAALWIVLDSQSRYAINGGHLNLTFDQLTFTPNERWSWGFGYWYLRSGFDGFTQANNFITSTFFLPLNDNWGFRTRHDYNAADGRLQEQNYSVYRDLRSWTCALTFRVIDNSTGRRITRWPSPSRSRPRRKSTSATTPPAVPPARGIKLWP